MPITSIPAAAKGMPNFDLARIMGLAWKIYRRDTALARPANADARHKAFSLALKSAWMTAKYEIAEARKTVQQRAADRVQELTTELMRDDARGWRVAGRADRLAVHAEISTLERFAASSSRQ